MERYLTISKGRKLGPFKLLDWQRALIMRVFSWVRPDSTRRFRTVYLQVGRQNGKSSVSAAIACYMLLADDEEQPICVSAATDRSQATIIYRDIEGHLRHNQALRNVVHCRPSTKEIEYPKRGGLFKALSADAPSKQGWSYHYVAVEELHLHRTPELYESLQYGTIARRQPIIFITTTAGSRKDSFCYEQYRYSKQILQGDNLDISYAPFIYEASSEQADMMDEREWHAANPSLKDGIQSLDTFREDAQAAQFSRTAEIRFRRYRLGTWLSAATTWIDLDAFDACAGQAPNLDGENVFLGLDLASTTDLVALVLVCPLDGKYYVKSWCWCPEAQVKKRAEGNLHRYETYIHEKSLTVTPGNAVDYSLIRQTVNEIGKQYRVVEVCMDPWNALHLAQELQADGFSVSTMTQSPANLNHGLKSFENAILERTLIHPGTELLRWQAANLVVVPDDKGNLRPSRKKSPEKIDSMIALVMAMSQANQQDERTKPQRSVYEDRPLFYLTA